LAKAKDNGRGFVLRWWLHSVLC